MMQTMIDYVNEKNESVYLYWEEDNETNVFMNYKTKQCEVIDDMKDGIYYIIKYLVNDNVRYFNSIDVHLLDAILYDITDNTSFTDNESKHLINKMLEYIEDYNVKQPMYSWYPNNAKYFKGVESY